MRHIAITAPFFPQDKTTLRNQLTEWNLEEDLDFREEDEGQISVYAKGGATTWPAEWTPDGGDEFETFEISDFLHKVAQPGQTIRTHDSGGTHGVYISRGVAASA